MSEAEEQAYQEAVPPVSQKDMREAIALFADFRAWKGSVEQRIINLQNYVETVRREYRHTAEKFGQVWGSLTDLRQNLEELRKIVYAENPEGSEEAKQRIRNLLEETTETMEVMSDYVITEFPERFRKIEDRLERHGHKLGQGGFGEDDPIFIQIKQDINHRFKEVGQHYGNVMEEVSKIRIFHERLLKEQKGGNAEG